MELSLPLYLAHISRFYGVASRTSANWRFQLEVASKGGGWSTDGLLPPIAAGSSHGPSAWVLRGAGEGGRRKSWAR